MKSCKCPYCGRVVELSFETKNASHKLPACKGWLELVKQIWGEASPVLFMGPDEEFHREEKSSQVL